MTPRRDADFAIVVIGRNEGERLRACLQSALAVCPHVVYADSASTDDSLQTARSMGTVAVEVDPKLPLNAARGRNLGLSTVLQMFPHSKYVQFVDGDCLLDPDWCQVATQFLDKHASVGIVCGRRFEADPQASFYNRLADQEWNTPVGPADACGGDAMMRISALKEVRGFNPSLMASEEPELAARLRYCGWEIWRLDAPMSEHDAKMMTFRQWWRRTIRTGYGYAQAWLVTRALPERVNAGRLRSAVTWIIMLPAFILALSLAARSLLFPLLLPVSYALQIFRMASRKRLSAESLKTASFILLAKVPELIGAAWALFSGGGAAIEYKLFPGVPGKKS